MKTSLLPAAAALLLAGTGCGSRSAAPAPEPIRLIVETDMGNDIDDALAFDLIYKAMDDGRVDLLAIGNHKLSPTATDYIDILNTWYGYPDIPLAQSPTPVLNDHAPDYTAAVCAMTREDGSPAFARSKTPEQIEDPVTLYRRTLAAQPDRSVTVLSLGFATELAKLLDSPADDISPLTGRELVARKVKTLSIMAGARSSTSSTTSPPCGNSSPNGTRRSCRTPSSWESKSCIPVRPSRTISAGRNSIPSSRATRITTRCPMTARRGTCCRWFTCSIPNTSPKASREPSPSTTKDSRISAPVPTDGTDG